jgi:selenocysteine-specific elongation factor
LDCRLHLLPSAKPLKHRAPVHFHSGTAEIEAEVRLFGTTALKPGATAYARLVLREAALLLPGDHFSIRRFSPVTTIGGGVVIDIGERRYRKTDDIAGRLDVLSSTDAAARVELLVRESRYGVPLSELVARTGLMESEIVAAAGKGVLAVVLQPEPWYIDRAWFQAARLRLVQTIRDFHRANPLQPGMPRQDLRGAVLPDAPPFLLDALFASAKEIAVEGETVRLTTHRIALKEDEEHARAAIERAFETAGLAAPAVFEVLAQSGVEAARARTLLQQLLHERRLVRIGADLVFHQSAIARLHQLLAARKGERFSVGAFKEWTGISRKYAIPLLEFLDRERVTQREGDERVVR